MFLFGSYFLFLYDVDLRVLLRYVFVDVVGVEVDIDRINFLLKELEGKDILEVIVVGKEKFVLVFLGGGGGVVVFVGVGVVVLVVVVEEKKEEVKKEEEKEEFDDVSFLEYLFFLNVK